MIVSWIKEPIRTCVRIIPANLGDEVAEGKEEALELTTDEKKLSVDSKLLAVTAGRGDVNG